MNRRHSCRWNAIVALSCFAAALFIVQACGRSRPGTAPSIRVAQRAISQADIPQLASADTCPDAREPDPPTNLLSGSAADFYNYVEKALNFVNDPHLSSQTVLLDNARVGTGHVVIGKARLQAERCAPELTSQQLQAGRIIARIISDANYSSPTLPLVKGIQYVWVDDLTTGSGRMRLVHVDTTVPEYRVQVLRTFAFTPHAYARLVRVPAATMFYDVNASLMMNTPCHDMCCGTTDSTGTARDSSEKHDLLMRSLLSADSFEVLPRLRARIGVPPVP